MSDSNEKEVLDMVVALLSVTPAERGSRLRALCGSDEVRARVVSVLRGLSEPVEKSEQVEKSEPVERIDQERGSRTFPISDDADNSQLADSFPKRIGAYTLLRRIGAGGMGQVFEAEQDKPRRRVALKLIHPHRMNRAMLRRFEYEAEFLGRLDHVGIARIYEAGSADSASGRQPFLAMELVDGPRLDEWARREALDLSRTIQMVIAIGDAITHAHQKGLIHRDLKPANILVVAGDQPKILDFGLARPLEDAAPLMTLATSEGQLLGTLQYMSPEQATGNIAELDTRTDVYALGVIAYELLGGKLPYDLKDKSFPEALDAIRSNEAPLLGTIDRRLSGDLETIVAKALSKQKSQRYDSAADFANDLRNSLAHRPILARAPSRMDLFRRFARRHVALLTASAAVALALVAGVIGTSWGMVRAQHARDQESAQRIRAEQANQIKDQVNDWVRDVLLAPDPANAQGREVTVKEVLDKAADGIDSTFQNEPMIAASLHGFVGSTYEGLGLAETSLRHFERECALLEMNAGSDALTTLQARANLAEPLYSLGRNDEAQRVLRDVIQRMNRVLGPDAQDTLVATGKLARNLQDSGKSSEALPILRDLLERERRVLGPDHESTLITASNLGWVLNALGKPGDAEPIDRFLLEQRKHVSGADHPETLAAQNNLARCLQDQGKLGEAEPLMRDLVERCKRVKGENHQHTLLAQNNLADMTVDLGRPAEAEPLYRDAYERLSKALGPDHPITLQAGGNLGACLSMLGKLSEAEPLQRRVVDGLERVRGPDHPATLGARSNLAQVLVKLNQADEACAILEEVVGRIRKLYGDHHARTLSCMNAYVQALQKAHRQEEAKQMYDALMKACDSPEVQIPAARISAYRSGFVAGPATGPTGATQPVGGANTVTHPE